MEAGFLLWASLFIYSACSITRMLATSRSGCIPTELVKWNSLLWKDMSRLTRGSLLPSFSGALGKAIADLVSLRFIARICLCMLRFTVLISTSEKRFTKIPLWIFYISSAAFLAALLKVLSETRISSASIKLRPLSRSYSAVVKTCFLHTSSAN